MKFLIFLIITLIATALQFNHSSHNPVLSLITILMATVTLMIYGIYALFNQPVSSETTKSSKLFETPSQKENTNGFKTNAIERLISPIKKLIKK